MHLASWLLPLLIACGSGPPPGPPPDLRPALARVTATLDEAARLDRDRREVEARAAWRRAHALFEAQVEPGLRQTLPAREVTETEYLFGRVRYEIDRRRGHPGRVAARLSERLEAQVDTVEAARPSADDP